jgi:iron complex outermembrane receptor protein
MTVGEKPVKVLSNKILVMALGFVVLSMTAWSVSAAKLEEITVTAQKRAQSLQDVGLSVSAFTGSELKDMGVNDTVDITQQVPGMQVFTWSPAFTVFNLRGVSQNNFQDNLEAPVAVYMDDAYVANMSAINAQLFDMQRVEVLRGPQGTLYGRNTTGGLVHYISNKPTQTEFNGYLEGTVGGYDNTGLNTYSVEGAAGGGLVPGLRARVAGRWQNSDGYIKPGSAFGLPKATGRTSQGANGYALRGILQYDVNENVTTQLIVTHSDDHDVPTGQYIVSLAGADLNTGLGDFQGYDFSTTPPTKVNFSGAPITGNVWEHFSNMKTYLNREVTSVSGQIKVQLPNGMELTSISNYLGMDKFYIEDAGGGLVFFPYNVTDNFYQVSEEMRLSGSSDRMRWQVGVYYLNMEWDTYQSVTGAAINAAPTPAYRVAVTDNAITQTYGDIKAENWSLFGHAEYDLNDQWTLIAGLRYSKDNKDLAMTRFFADSGQGIARMQTFDVATVGIPGINTIHYGDWAARLQLNWHPMEDTLIYASFARGIKGGNWSLDPLGAVAYSNLKHKNEVLYDYELGLKTTLMNGLARFNADAFYYDYRNYQAFSLTNLVPQVTNSDAREYGGEIEFTVSPTDGLDVSLGASFLDSKVDAVPTVFGGLKKAEFPNAPTVSLNWLARYVWPVPNVGGNLALQLDGNWNDSQYLEGTNSQISHEPSYSVWNGRVSYTTDDTHWKATAWVKNFTNTKYRLYDLDLGLLGFTEQMYAPPRQIGGTITYSW